MTRYAVGYIRKSKRDDDSADAQRVAVLALAKRNGDTIAPGHIYDDNGRSGSRAGLARRRGYLELLDAVERDEVSTVYVRVNDRLGRGMTEHSRLWDVLEDHGTRLCDESRCYGPEDEMLYHMQGMMARAVGKQQSERAQYILRRRIERGDDVTGGQSAPYGYMQVREDGGRIANVRATEPYRDQCKACRADPEHVHPAEPLETVLAIARAEPTLLGAMARLNAEGIPHRGRPWSYRGLEHIIRRHAPDILAARRHQYRRHGTTPLVHYLSRVVRCHCGGYLTPARMNGYDALYCARAKGHPEHPRPNSVAQRAVLAIIEAGTRWKAYRLTDAVVPDADAAIARADLEAKRARLSKALAEAVEHDADTGPIYVRLDAVKAAMAALDAEADVERQLTIIGRPDWTDVAAVNRWLRATFPAGIPTGPDLLPDPEWLRTYRERYRAEPGALDGRA